MLEKVISGGQTGADQAGLHAAEIYRIPTGGFCPAGFRTLLGPQPSLGQRFGLVCTDSESYPPRTKRNVHMADATVRLASDFNTPGERLTLSYCNEFSKPVLSLVLDGTTHEGKALQLSTFIRTHKVSILNVAGNGDREQIYGKHFNDALEILMIAFRPFAR